MRTDHDPSSRLERLSRMREYDVAPNEPDPRGWTVASRDGRAVGAVKDLVVDTDRMAVTYLDVELDWKLFDLRDGDDAHVLVPVERAHREGRRVTVDDIGVGWVTERRAARERHQREFWERWWSRGGTGREGYETPIRRLDPDELNRVIDHLRPGESVRIPVAPEEIVVERRSLEPQEPVREDVVVNRADDEPPWRRR